MTGNEFYDKEWERKIDAEFNRVKNKECVNDIKGFNNYMIANGTMVSSRRMYLNKAVNFINTLDKSLTEINFSDCVSFLSGYKDKTSSYQIQVYMAIKNFIDYLYKNEIIKKNYMLDISSPQKIESIKTVQKRAKSYLTREEMETFILNAKYGNGTYETKRKDVVNARNYAMIMLMLNTGLRCSAICKLDVSNINFDMSDDDYENGVYGILEITEKRGKIRTCVISEKLSLILKKWLNVRDEFATIETDDALFLTFHGGRITPNDIRKIVRTLGKGIKDIEITPHKLRATYGTMIYEETNDVYLTQVAMGHSNVQTTMLYVRGQEEKVQRKAAEIMGKLTF